MLNPRRSGEPRHPARTSSITSASNLTRRLTANSAGVDWQTKVREYDRDGPGVCGFYLDLIDLLASLCPLIIEEQQDNGEWVRSDNPVLNTLLRGYSSALIPQAELVGRHARHRESMGEAWLVNSEELGWNVVTVPNITMTKNGVQWHDPFGIKRITPENRVWKSWVHDPYEPWKPHSPLRRSLDDLRRLKAAVRNQTRSAESPLATNGMMAFPDDGNGLRPLADNDDDFTDADQLVADYIELAKASFENDDHPAAAVPFPMIGGAPEYVEVGRGIDSTALQVEEKALESFARSVNFPAQLLTNGPGSANHWNEWLLEEAQRKMGLSPKLVPVCADITVAFLRPMAQLAARKIGDFDAQRINKYRVGFDTTFLTSKPDNTSQLMTAWSQGVIDREAVIDGLGLPQDSMLEIPDGMQEYTHWQLATQKPGAPYAEVDENGALVEAPDLFGGEGDPFAALAGGPPGGDGGQMALPFGAPGGELPAGPEGAEAAQPPAAPPVEPETLGAANQAPPPPPPMLAALSDPVIEEAVIDRLYRADVALEAALTARAQVCVEQVTDHVAREIVKAHEPQSEKRAELRDLPSEQVWVNADPEVRNSFDLETVVAEAVDECSSREPFDDAAADARAALAPYDRDPEFNEDGGSTLLTLLLIGFIVNRLRKGKGSPRFPAGDIRAAMIVAGGARTGGGQLARSGDGTPVPTRGGKWTGNGGMTTGHAVFNDWPDPLKWEWVHSFYGRPETPFPPHLALDGTEFSSLAEIAGGWFPGDHKWCRCGIRPAPVRVPVELIEPELAGQI